MHKAPLISARSATKLSWLLVFILVVFSALAPVARATELTSTSYKVLDPIFQVGGGTTFATSSSFELYSSIAQIAVGTSSSSGFDLNAGFLYFPFVSSPVVIATAGDAQVSLSWTASTGVLGWTVSGYNVGRSTTAGGPYTYSTSLGNVTSSTRTGLTNSTTYYFIVRAEDAFGNSVATSSEVSSTPVASISTPTPPPSAVGGGPAKLPIVLPFVVPFLPLTPEIIPLACPPGALVTDLDCDGGIGIRDLSIFIYLGGTSFPNRADFNKDVVIDTQDLSILFTDWTERLLTFVPEQQFDIFTKKRETFYGEREFAVIGGAVAQEAKTMQKDESPDRIGFFNRMTVVIKTVVQKVSSFISLLFKR